MSCGVGEIAMAMCHSLCAGVLEVLFSDPRMDDGIWIDVCPEGLFPPDCFTNHSKCEPHSAIIENV